MRDNVALQLRLTGTRPAPARRRAEQTLERLGLGALATADVRRLSGGEAQRVALCAAVAHGPALVLADEPTGELDEEAAHQVYGLLEAVAADGTGVILVSHDPRSDAFVDRAVRLRDGRLAEEWVPGRTPVAQVADSRGWVRVPGELLDRRVGTTDELDRVAGRRRPAAPARPRRPVARPPSRRPVTGGAPARPTGERRRRRRRHARRGGGGLGRTHAVRRPRPGAAARDWTALRGPSGSGKSTLLTLVAGLTDPRVGPGRGGRDGLGRARPVGPCGAPAPLARVRAAARQPGRDDDRRRERRAGRRVPGADRRSDEVAALGARLGLAAQLGTPAGVLSGGERQRASLARVLVSGAPVLVLDEPTSQQDDVSAARVVAALEAATRAGAAVLVASHDAGVLDRADVLLVLDGQAVETISSARARSGG